jgi:outer membrane protein TolC
MMRRRSSLALALVFVGGVARAQAPAAIGFDEAVREAIGRNPNAQVAAEEIERAHAVVVQVRAASFPTLAANGSYTHLDGSPTQAGGSVSADVVGANLALTLPLVQPRAWAQWRHANEGVRVARLAANEVKRELAATVARTYLSILAQHRVIEVSQRARTTALAHHAFAHQRFAGGYGNRVDEVRAAEEVATDQAQLETAQAGLERLREALGVLIGTDHALDVTGEVALPMPSCCDERDLGAREDLRLFRGKLDLASQIRRDSWTEYLPSLNAVAQPFWQSQPTTLLPGGGWQASLNLSWSLYDGGLRYGLVRERKSLEREARLNLESAARQASAEVRTADDEVRRSSAALQAERQAAKLATEALSLTNVGYQAGASTNIEVVDAERRARDADTAVAQAEDAYRQAVLDLLLATGRFPGTS